MGLFSLPLSLSVSTLAVSFCLHADCLFYSTFSPGSLLPFPYSRLLALFHSTSWLSPRRLSWTLKSSNGLLFQPLSSSLQAAGSGSGSALEQGFPFLLRAQLSGCVTYSFLLRPSACVTSSFLLPLRRVLLLLSCSPFGVCYFFFSPSLRVATAYPIQPCQPSSSSLQAAGSARAYPLIGIAPPTAAP